MGKLNLNKDMGKAVKPHGYELSLYNKYARIYQKRGKLIVKAVLFFDKSID